MCRIDQCDPWDVYRAEHRRAAKAHRCGDCAMTIERGERYHHGTGLSDGYWTSYRQCARCEAAGLWLVKVCGGWCWDGVGEELIEHWDEEWQLRSHSFGRLVLAARRQWQGQDGAVLTPEQVTQLTERAIERLPALASR